MHRFPGELPGTRLCEGHDMAENVVISDLLSERELVMVTWD